MKKILYGGLFVIVLPASLILWAVASKDRVAMPSYGSPALGWAFAVVGLAVMLAAMSELWRFGGGLPMNAFPPPKLVSRGTFHYLPHPIYTGFVLLCLGISIIAKSASGLWLVTPCVVLGCIALVLGYERNDLERRVGRTLRFLPADEESPPSTLERIRFLILVVVPWLALYELTIQLPLSGSSFGFPFEERLPIYPWTALFYESTYLLVALAPWFARTRSDLCQLTISAWMAMAVVFPLYWFVPSRAPRRLLLGDDWLTHTIGNDASRFIEEGYRGEPQTPIILGLRLYQWLALSTVVIGAIITILSSPPPPPLRLSLMDVILAASFASLASAALGLDFPESNGPLARLT